MFFSAPKAVEKQCLCVCTNAVWRKLCDHLNALLVSFVYCFVCVNGALFITLNIALFLIVVLCSDLTAYSFHFIQCVFKYTEVCCLVSYLL